LTLDSGEVRFEPTKEVPPIVFYLLYALWDFVNKEVSSGKLKPTFATSRIFWINSDTAFIGPSKSEASKMMLVNVGSKMAVSRACCPLEGVPPCISPLGCVSPLAASGSSTGLEAPCISPGCVSCCVSPLGCVSCCIFPLEGVPTGGSSTGVEQQQPIALRARFLGRSVVVTVRSKWRTRGGHEQEIGDDRQLSSQEAGQEAGQPVQRLLQTRST